MGVFSQASNNPATSICQREGIKMPKTGAPAPKPPAAKPPAGGAPPPAGGKPGAAPPAGGKPAAAPPAGAPPAGGAGSDASTQLAQNSADGTAQARADAAANVKTNNEIAAIGMWAATQAALIKMKTDMNDAMNSMIKGVGGSIKSAAQ
jgi:hypothetical protein